MINYKKLNILFVILSFIFLFVAYTAYIIIDPYDENGLIYGDFNKKSRSSYSSSRLLYKKLESEEFTLAFGTSRSAKVDDYMLGHPILNFSQSVYGNPGDVLYLLNELNNKQIDNIHEIFYLVDNHVLKKRLRHDLDYNASTLTILFNQIRDMNLTKANHAYRTVKHSLSNKSLRLVKHNGSVVNKAERKNPERTKFEQNLKKIAYPIYEKEALKWLEKINEFCKKNQIKITYYSPPMNTPFLNKLHNDKFIEQRKKLLEHIPSLVELFFVPKISEHANNYTDLTHLNTEALSQVVKNTIVKNSTKYSVTENNADVFYANLFSNVNKEAVSQFWASNP